MVTVAAVQATPVFLDAEATAAKAANFVTFINYLPRIATPRPRRREVRTEIIVQQQLFAGWKTPVGRRQSICFRPTRR